MQYWVKCVCVFVEKPQQSLAVFVNRIDFKTTQTLLIIFTSHNPLKQTHYLNLNWMTARALKLKFVHQTGLVASSSRAGSHLSKGDPLELWIHVDILFAGAAWISSNLWCIEVSGKYRYTLSCLM